MCHTGSVARESDGVRIPGLLRWERQDETDQAEDGRFVDLERRSREVWTGINQQWMIGAFQAPGVKVQVRVQARVQVQVPIRLK